MAQDLSQFTDMWMANPWMFDPTQKSNQFSNYNNAPLPWPPTYNGAPTNAATGQPIASFQAWQQANPGGTTLNSTPAQPQAAPAPAAPAASSYPPGTPWAALQAAGATPQQMGMFLSQMRPTYPGSNVDNPNFYSMLGQTMAGARAPAAPQAAPQASGPPNNWQAALNALANPGNPVTPGANVPLVQGYQPAGGVNNAFLQQAGAGQGMNQNFLSALRAIQGRPQQGM